MNLKELDRDVGQLVREYEYDDGSVIAVDLGAGDGSVDVVGDTVIVVFGEEQHEIALPESADAQAFMKNGVLTIEVNDQ